jgi:hypothetical protein
MTIGKKEVTFHWSNYTKPTPANLERITGGLKDIMAGIAGITIVSEHYTVSLALTIAIIVLGQLVKFFASVAMEERSNQPPQA